MKSRRLFSGSGNGCGSGDREQHRWPGRSAAGLCRDASFQIDDAVKNIAKGAVEGGGELAASGSVINLTTTIGNLSRGAAAALSQLTDDATTVADLVQGLQVQVELEVDAIETGHPTLIVDTIAIKTAAADGLKQGLIESEVEGVDPDVIVSTPGEDSALTGGGSTTGGSTTVEVRPQEVRPQEVRPQEVRPQEVRPQEVRPQEVRPQGSTTGGSTTGGSTTGGSTLSSCTFNSQTVAHGSSVTAYSASSVAYGSTCQSETRTCSDGTLSGSFTHASCTVESPAMSGVYRPLVVALPQG